MAGRAVAEDGEEGEEGEEGEDAVVPTSLACAAMIQWTPLLWVVADEVRD
jgi:hypothetical protein